MDTFFADYIDRLEHMQRDFHQALEGLPNEALDWVPGPQMNSVAVLLAHTAGSLRFWIGDIAMGEPSNRVRELEFETRNQSLDDMLGRLDAAIDYARAALPRLSVADLAQKGAAEPGREPSTRGWALLHALEHASMHLGHIQLTSQLWKTRPTP